MGEITASGMFGGQRLDKVEVCNPGDWFGKTWLIEIGGSYWPLFLVVEADSVQDAIDEFAESTKFSHHIVVPPEDLGDYPEDERHYGPNGQVIDLDHVMVHGQEGAECPWPCTYHGDGLPPEGVKPTDFCWEDHES
ncbi:MAG TPA: hypothetical protein PKD86_00135 [Gemmatales bacterium]|nr:hypothetical protein [Gemmatales bacterium]